MKFTAIEPSVSLLHPHLPLVLAFFAPPAHLGLYGERRREARLKPSVGFKKKSGDERATENGGQGEWSNFNLN